MTKKSGVRFPGESDEYRRARQKLLSAERKLRREVEKVAGLRRALPPGQRVACDYEFDEIDAGTGKVMTTRLSQLFELPRKSLVVYSFMYAPGGNPCPMCTAFLDSLNGAAPHAGTQINLAVVAKGPIRKIRSWAKKRRWSNLRLLSSGSNTFNQDYFAELGAGAQLPMITVSKKTRGVVRHCYTTEIFFDQSEPGQHPRYIDMLFPLWNLFDLTPEGRPEKWFPQLSY